MSITVGDIVKKLDLTVCCGEDSLNKKVTGGFAGDLLSDVIANSKAGDVWVTMQVHINTVAVAVLKELSAIILVNGRQPSDETLQRAKAERVPIVSTTLSTFETVGKLHALGLGAAS